jgi:FkbM family methyltransferase
MTWLLHALRDLRHDLFERRGKRSYAQEGEDRILRRIFERRPQGFYVDVGAHHPTRFSNTHLFYTLGWRGINIEPSAEAIARFERLRPRDINVAAAVAEREGDATYYLFDEPALNTLDRALAEERERTTPYRIVGQRKLDVTTLAALLRRWLPAQTHIDFLSVDVEGLDLGVLRSSDWQTYRPDVVLVEALGTAGPALFESELHLFLDSVGYRWIARTLNTLFYVERVAAAGLDLS